MNILSFFTSDYLFNPLPQTDFLLGFPLIAYFLILLFTKSIIRNFFYSNKYAKKTLKKKVRKYPFIGGIGLFFILTRFGEIEWLSMRVFLYGVILVSIIFLLIDTKKSITEYRERIKSAERERKK